MDKISDYLSTSDLLCQLAEECSELAQAALKLKRAMDGTNPTPKSEQECWESLEEEMADVDLVIDEIISAEHRLCIERLIDIRNDKRERWLKRLKGAQMTDCINRKEAIDDFEKCNQENPVWTPQRVKTLLMRAPSLDTTLVVQCQDCKHWRNDICWCSLHSSCKGSDYFCADGEWRGTK